MQASLRRTAVVTGAARGIGAEVARKLHQDGFALALMDLEAEDCAAVVDELLADGGIAMAFGGDVSHEDDVARVAQQIKAELGSPSVLINNAGVTRDNLLHKMSTDDWDAVMGVHLRGSFLMSRAISPTMVESGWGRIVNLSSVNALGRRGQANYSAAKAGLQGLTKTLALELGRFGITVNAVAPGFIVTDMTAATATRLGLTFEELQTRALADIAVGRVGSPADVANVVSFFVSPSSSFISGQVLYATGGPRG